LNFLDYKYFETDDDLFAATGTMLFDVESYPNYFLVSFLHLESNRICYFEMHDDTLLQSDYIKWILRNFCVVGFNSNDYDMIVLSYALRDDNVRPADIKHLTNELIVENARSHDVQQRLKFTIFPANHIDLIEVAPLSASLKTYAARLHCEHIQDLPYHHESILTAEEKNKVRYYNFNDLANTKLLLQELSPHLELRAKLGIEFHKDLRSLSDAQLAQEIINTELKRITGFYPKRPDFKKLVGSRFKYIAPKYISFQTDHLKAMLSDIQNATIEIGQTGHVIAPKEIEGRKIQIDTRIYTIGMGGLHSVETCQAIVSTAEHRIIDADVKRYYPELMLKNKFGPEHLGEAFFEALQLIVDKEIKLKAEGDLTIVPGLKIARNGVFGKTSDPWSTVYSPLATVQTTLTGQLSLLMLIEALTHFGFKVVSANTDGVITIVPVERYDEFCIIIQVWETQTKLEMEKTDYTAVYSRDVNNYIAVKAEGKKPKSKWYDEQMGVKPKGAFCERGSAQSSVLSKNPECLITVDAVIAHIVDGTPIDQTIRACKNIKRFVSVRKVTGGAQKDGRYLGKTIRWYYATGVIGTINRATNGHTVPLTEGAKPCMTLPAAFPSDINYDRYIEDATDILEKIGFNAKRNAQITLF
jgi:hypothetical protein